MNYRTALYFITLFLLMLIAGVFWGTWFTLTRSIESFSASEFIHIGKVIIVNVKWPMRILMPTGILFTLASLWVYPHKKARGFYFMLASFVLILATLLITLSVLVPIDNEIRQWTAATVPAQWENIRATWQTFHALRTFTSVASFGCFAWAVMGNKVSK